MIRLRNVVVSLLTLAAACSPKAPAPTQCSADSDCFNGGVCNAGGTCVLGAAIDPTKSTIDVGQDKAVANGTDVVAITVTLRDASGNPLSSRGVQLSVDGTGNTLVQPTLSTNSVGQVVGTLTSTKAEIKNVSALAGIVTGKPTTKGVKLTKTAQIEFDADSAHLAPPGTGKSATNISITAADGVSAPNVVADGTTPVKIHLILRDANGNPVPNQPVFFSVSGTGITLSPASGAGTTSSDGSFDATLTSQVAQTATLNLVVGAISQSVTIVFHPGTADVTHSAISISIADVSCGGTSEPACVLAASADPSVGPVAVIGVMAQDAFGNLEPNAQVWFSWADTEQGDNFKFPSSAAAANPPQGGGQNDPLLTLADGTVTNIQFYSDHAEVKTITVHIDSFTLVLPPITVTAAAPSLAMSQFALFGTLDGTPATVHTGGYSLNAYIADQYNNPAPNILVSFASSAGSADSITALDQAFRCNTVAPVLCRSWDDGAIDGATYATGERVVATDGNVYSSLIDGNKGFDPTATVGTDWALESAVSPAVVVTDETGQVAFNLTTDKVSPTGAPAGVRTITATTTELTSLWQGSGCVSPAPTPLVPCTPSVTATFGPAGPSQFLTDGTTPASTLSLSATSVSTDIGNPVTITLHLRDAYGNDTPGQGLLLDAFTGFTNPAVPGTSCSTPPGTCVFTLPQNPPSTGSCQTPGCYAANIASPTAEPVTVMAVINGTGPNGSFASGDLALYQTAPSTPAIITFKPGLVDANNSSLVLTSNDNIVADGNLPTHAAAFLLTLKDAQGNPVPAKAPIAVVAPSTLLTAITAPTTGSDGTSTITFGSKKA